MTTTSPPPVPLVQPALSWRQRILDAWPLGLLIASLAGSCGAWHWLFDLASHFRWYYFLFGIAGVAATCRRARSLAHACLATVIVWNGGLLLPYYWPRPQPPVPNSATTLSLISVNVYTGNQNKAAVVKYLRDRQPDLILVMEVNSSWAIALNELKDVYPYRFIDPRPDNFGIGMLSKWPLQQPRVVEFAGTDLPNIITSIECDKKSITFIGTHPLPPVGAAATKERNLQLSELAEFVNRISSPCIVAGDFNATPWSFAFRDFVARSGLQDTSLGRGSQGSWNARSWLMRIPIDQVFVSPKAVVLRRAIGPDVGSDHFPVEATIAFP